MPQNAHTRQMLRYCVEGNYLKLHLFILYIFCVCYVHYMHNYLIYVYDYDFYIYCQKATVYEICKKAMIVREFEFNEPWG